MGYAGLGIRNSGLELGRWGLGVILSGPQTPYPLGPYRTITRVQQTHRDHLQTLHYMACSRGSCKIQTNQKTFQPEGNLLTKSP